MLNCVRGPRLRYPGLGTFRDALLDGGVALDSRVHGRDTVDERRQIDSARTIVRDTFLRAHVALATLNAMRKKQEREGLSSDVFQAWRKRHGENIFSLIELTWDFLRERAGEPASRWAEHPSQVRELRRRIKTFLGELSGRPVPLLSHEDLVAWRTLCLNLNGFTGKYKLRHI